MTDNLTPAGNSGKAPEIPDPFDLAKWRLNPSFDSLRSASLTRALGWGGKTSKTLLRTDASIITSASCNASCAPSAVGPGLAS
jgi:hypothetical protein